MNEEEKKAIERLDRLTIGKLIETKDVNEASNILHDRNMLLNLIEKQQNKIKDVKTRLEYYLIGNMSFNEEAQEEFKQLLKMLEEPEEQHIKHLIDEEQKRYIKELQETIFPVGTILFIPYNKFPIGKWEPMDEETFYYKRIK